MKINATRTVDYIYFNQMKDSCTTAEDDLSRRKWLIQACVDILENEKALKFTFLHQIFILDGTLELEL
jgi:hypothetical protein